MDRIKSPELDLLPAAEHHPVLDNDENADTEVSSSDNNNQKQDEEEMDQVLHNESDDEGNQIPVVQIPLSDLISGSAATRSFHSNLMTQAADPYRLETEVRKSAGRLPDPHSCPLASVTSSTAVDCKQAKTLDAARAQMAVSAVYNNILSSPTNTSLDVLSGKSCQMGLGDPVLSNGPDRLNTMH